MNDGKEALEKERKRREDQLDLWYGMRRQTITPEIRAEFKALDLRGFVDAKTRYRGVKRQNALSKAESGFFQIGTVVAGGIHDKGVAEYTSVTTSKRKKTKTLLTTLLKDSLQ